MSDGDPVKEIAEVIKRSDLLLKEMDEINSWVRLAFQMYFGWFALQFTINAVAVGWIFSSKGAMPPFVRLVFGLLLIWNLMGTITTFVIRKHMLNFDRRIRQVIDLLTERGITGDPDFKSRSPIPRQAIITVFGLCAVTMLTSMLFWAILMLKYKALFASA